MVKAHFRLAAFTTRFERKMLVRFQLDGNLPLPSTRMLPLPDAPLLTDQSKLANHGHGKAKGI
jgi:hypothetical protein